MFSKWFLEAVTYTGYEMFLSIMEVLCIFFPYIRFMWN